jgi:hypothetical protein
MIIFELTETDARSISGALTRRAADMMKELVHTDDRTMHAELKASYEQLDRLQRDLARLIATAQPST